MAQKTHASIILYLRDLAFFCVGMKYYLAGTDVTPEKCDPL